MNRDIIGSLYKLKANFKPTSFYEILLIIGLDPTCDRVMVEAYDKDEVINLAITFDELYDKYKRVG